MQAIYEPKGRAREYAELACNLYRGCSHGCKYCYAPACMRMSREKYHSDPAPRNGILTALDHDARKWSGTDKRVLLSFTSDPYQPIESFHRVTRQSLEILECYRIPAAVLTKNGTLAQRDFDIMLRANVHFGSTIIFMDDGHRAGWEPNAASIPERMAAVRRAHSMGIYTWVSVEPVIDTDEALDVIATLLPHVDFWKVGKLNHFADLEREINWQKFLEDAEFLLKGRKYMVKHDLLVAAGREHEGEMIL